MPAPLSHAVRPRSRRTRVRRDRKGHRRPFHRWQRYIRSARRKFFAAPPSLRIVAIAATALAIFAVMNLGYQTVRKPTEMLFPLGSAMNKTPATTWRQYAPLFREYSTATITPELLAALAQVEGAGNPMARTYWRWRLTWHPFSIYKPASSAVGMYQMTDAAFAEARHYCIHRHTVVEDGCWFNSLYTRILPSNAIELTAIYLDRNVTGILARWPNVVASPQQKQSLAVLVQLCGAGRAEAYLRRGFHLILGERCGDHDAAPYLARVNVLKRQFARLAADQ